MRRLAKAARRLLANESWSEEGWARVADLRQGEKKWVETVGLGRKHLVATAATLRVSSRLMGMDHATGVSARMELGRLLGHSDKAGAVAAALAGIGLEFCRPRERRCEACPLAGSCLSSGKTALNARRRTSS